MVIPWASLFGGMLLGFAALILLVFNGKVAGISGILNGWLENQNIERLWRQWFIIGMIGAGALSVWYFSLPIADLEKVSSWLLIVAGICVGIGTRMANGCTSGHGICGLGRLSIRSLVATITFMITAMLTVFIRLHLI